MKSINKKVFLLVSCLLLLVAHSTSAAEVFFGVHSKDVGVNSKFETGVFLDTQKESINAVEAQIVFPSDSLKFEGFYNGDSLITFWIQQPALTSKGVVSFSGIVPGGFTGQKGHLFSLIFKAIQKSKVTISANQEKALLDDGIGSEVKITKAPLVINIVERSSAQTFTPIYDPNPPESFEPQISKDLNIFDGKYFLVFATQDKDSGIDHYEVMETGQPGSFQSLFTKNLWAVAENPYLLQDQSLESVVYVKAIDRSGNERIAKINARHFVPLYENYFIWSIIILIVAIFYIVKKVLWKRKQTIIKH